MKPIARVVRWAVLTLLLAAVLTVPALAVSSAPYNGYNYDPYGNATAAPQGYVPDKTVDYRDMGLDKALNNPLDFCVYTDHEGVTSLWIADTGNHRIIRLDENYKLVAVYDSFRDADGKEWKLISPKSVYLKYNEALQADEIFVCTGGEGLNDKGKAIGPCHILTAKYDGVVVKRFDNPTDAVIQLDDFRPSAVVMDNSGYLYVHIESCTEGLVVLQYSDGAFMTYYGANKVVLNWQTSVQQFWKKIFSREASVGMISLTPTEISGIFMDNDGFLYTTTSSTDMDKNLRVRKLNAFGDNVLNGDANALVSVIFGDRERKSASSDTRMVDIHVDDDGVMACLDGERGRIYLYDSTCTLLTVFGFKTDGSGNTQMGATFEAIGVEKMGADYLILDKKVGTIVSYKPTYYIEMLQKANYYYLKGWYVEGEEAWREVIKYNANFARGYAAIGKSLLEQEKYEDALFWLQEGQDRTSYSMAFTEFRREYLRNNLIWLLPVAIAVIVAFVLLIKLIQKLLGVKRKKTNVDFK